jgi:tetratricopeptide (TPR) repeat protein
LPVPQIGTRLSATLIVRDEATVLGDCLRSLRGVADEIVVVDTGSRDASRQIAADCGALVFDFPWQDDFSAARNHALDRATGDWALYIDADERVRGIDGPALRARLDDPDLVACTVRFHPRTGFTAYPEHRLFRRDDRIRFAGAIHETMMPAIRALVAAGVGRIGTSALTIDHVGYDGDQAHKLDRNERLLRKQIAADPRRTYLRWHLGTVERDRGRLGAAEETWTEGVELVRAKAAPEPEDALCFIELVKLRLARSDEALPLIAEAERACPGNWLLHWLRGKALVAAGQDAQALPVFEALSRIDADTLIAPMAFDRRLFGPFAFAEMGHCAFRLDRLDDSARYYRLARPGNGGGLSSLPDAA